MRIADCRLRIPRPLALYALGTNSRALLVVHAQGEYLWLQEVHPDFLNRLPPWPPTAA